MPINEPGGLRKQIQVRRKPQPQRRRVYEGPPAYYRARHPQGVSPGTYQPKAWRSDAPWLISPNYAKRQRRLV